MTDWPSHDSVPSWSRDGKWIYFGSSRTGAFEIWKLAADGGEAIQVTREGGGIARESPDGRFVFVRSLQKPSIFRVPVTGGEEEEVIGTNGPAEQWDVYDEGICFVETPAGEKPAVMCYELATEKLTRIAVLEKVPKGIAVSPDGTWMVYDQEDVSGSDLVLVENFR